MKYRKIAIISLTLLGLQTASLAQDGKSLFEGNCAACHSIGKGKLVGPDLKGVHEKRNEAWLVSFIQDPNGFAGSDADAKAIATEYNNMMPAQPLSPDEIKAVVTYIGTFGSAEMIAKTEDQAPKEEDAESAWSSDNASASLIDSGMYYFSGELAFDSGGAACISCHNVRHDGLVGGGRLAKDLTKAHERLGDAGITGLLSRPAFPAMRSAYGEGKSLTDKEITALTSFLNSASTAAPYQQARTWDWVLTFGGGTIAFCFIAFLMFVFRDRKTKSVKHDILDRQGYYDNK